MSRTFTGYRPKVPEHYIEGGYGNAPDEAQFQGIEFDDGTVAVRWLTQYRSTSLWPNFEEFQAVHGHADYETRIEWAEAAQPTQPPQPLDVERLARALMDRFGEVFAQHDPADFRADAAAIVAAYSEARDE